MKKHKESDWFRGLKEGQRLWDAVTNFEEHKSFMQDIETYKNVNGEDEFYKGLRDSVKNAWHRVWEKRFSFLPNDGVERFIIVYSDKDKTPSSFKMYYGYYFNGGIQYAANEFYAQKALEENAIKYPEYLFEIYKLLPNRLGKGFTH